MAPSRTPSLADLAQEDLVTSGKTQGDHGLLRAQQLGRHSPTAGRNDSATEGAFCTLLQSLPPHTPSFSPSVTKKLFCPSSLGRPGLALAEAAFLKPSPMGPISGGQWETAVPTRVASVGQSGGTKEKEPGPPERVGTKGERAGAHGSPGRRNVREGWGIQAMNLLRGRGQGHSGRCKPPGPRLPGSPRRLETTDRECACRDGGRRPRSLNSPPQRATPQCRPALRPHRPLPSPAEEHAGGRSGAKQVCVQGARPPGWRREPRVSTQLCQRSPGSHAPGVRASSWGPGVRPRPPRLAGGPPAIG